MTELAVFDLDYTLTRRGTWGRFISQSLAGRPLAAAGLWTVAGVTQAQYKLGLCPRIAVKTAMMQRSISGWSRTRLESMADDFVAQDVANGLNPRVLDALRQHQDQGHKVLIASAAIDLLVERYGTALGVDGTVSTQLSWTADDHLATGFASKNCYGDEKLRRTKAWIAENGLTPTFVTAYSDSRADAPLFEFADRAIVVAPKRKTSRYAQAKGFQVWR